MQKKNVHVKVQQPENLAAKGIIPIQNRGKVNWNGPFVDVPVYVLLEFMFRIVFFK